MPPSGAGQGCARSSRAARATITQRACCRARPGLEAARNACRTLLRSHSCRPLAAHAAALITEPVDVHGSVSELPCRLARACPVAGPATAGCLQVAAAVDGHMRQHREAARPARFGLDRPCARGVTGWACTAKAPRGQACAVGPRAGRTAQRRGGTRCAIRATRAHLAACRSARILVRPCVALVAD